VRENRGISSDVWNLCDCSVEARAAEGRSQKKEAGGKKYGEFGAGAEIDF
jgi:hypothetical protein